MKKAAVLTLIFTLAFVSSCVQSVHPLYTEMDLISDDSLLGTWEDKESGESWTFAKAGRLKYKLIQLDGTGRAGEFDARLVRIEGKLFIDIVPIKPDGDGSEFFHSLSLETHTFVQLSRDSDTIAVSYLEMSWLKDLLVDQPDAVRYERVNGQIVLTSAPKETQKFLFAHLKTKGAFSEPFELTRRQQTKR